MDSHLFLIHACIYLSAAVLAVPICKRLGLGSILGYLVAGVILGPWGIRLVTDVEHILYFAEFGVMLMLFLIGLEIHPSRLWRLRKPILGLGGLQLLLTVVTITLIASLMEIPWQWALVTGMSLALSSTAIALQTLQEKHLLRTSSGQAGFSVLLFQDIAVIPMLTIIPLLGVNMVEAGITDSAGERVLLIIATISGIVIGGRTLLRPMFRFIANTGAREIFTAFTLLLIIGIALIMDYIGLSMALGTFLAGMLLADSEYRHELEIDIEPFKGLLMGLFFISVGMSIDFGLLFGSTLSILLTVFGLVLLKACILFFLGWHFSLKAKDRVLFSIILAQGSEFAFVLLGFASSIGVITQDYAAQMIAAVALSMLSTPILMFWFDWKYRKRPSGNTQDLSSHQLEENSRVIIAGFGRFGQITGRLLLANNIPVTLLDHDANHIEVMKKLGFRVFYGDASRVDILEAAGAQTASILVLAIDAPDTVLKTLNIVQEHFPHLRILARARDRDDAHTLLNKGVTHVFRETFESGLSMAEETLRQLGMTEYEARKASELFREHDLTMLRNMAPNAEDEKTRLSRAAKAREELQLLMRKDKKFYEPE